MVMCLERGAGLHTAQLMPLPLTVCCFSKIQMVPDKGELNWCVYVALSYLLLSSEMCVGRVWFLQSEKLIFIHVDSEFLLLWIL